MAKRVEIFQKHMNEKMVLVEPEGWKQVEKLVNTAMESKGKISEDMVQEGPGKADWKKNYADGVRNIYKNSSNILNFTHKDTVVLQALGRGKKEVAKLKEERAKQPQKTAVSFAELQKKEKKAAVKRESRVSIGRRPERAAAKRPEDIEKKSQGMERKR